MWFNPGELLKDKIIPLANSANPANYEPESSKDSPPLISKLAELAESDDQKTIVVICYNPLGVAFEIEATSTEHAKLLIRMNPGAQKTKVALAAVTT